MKHEASRRQRGAGLGTAEMPLGGREGACAIDKMLLHERAVKHARDGFVLFGLCPGENFSLLLAGGLKKHATHFFTALVHNCPGVSRRLKQCAAQRTVAAGSVNPRLTLRQEVSTEALSGTRTTILDRPNFSFFPPTLDGRIRAGIRRDQVPVRKDDAHYISPERDSRAHNACLLPHQSSNDWSGRRNRYVKKQEVKPRILPKSCQQFADFRILRGRR